MRRTPLAAAAGMLIGAQAMAYTFPVQNQGGTFVRPHWPAGALPVLMRINDQLTGGLPPNVSPGSDPIGALTRALTHWPAVCGITFQQGSTSVTDGGSDGVNVMTFADTPANRQALEMAGEPIAVTLAFFVNDELREADILFNPQAHFTTAIDNDPDLDSMGLEDIEGVATHELGHAIGLHHSGVESAAMWPIASVLDRQPDADDIAGARTLYPVPPPHGTISGTVSVNGTPAFGAQVVALNAAGVVAAAALTLPNGTYAIESLPPDTYTVYVEPFDGPQAVSPNGGCVLIGNLSGAGIYGGAILTVNFATAFAGGNATPTQFPLADGADITVDFNLTSGVAAVNPVVIGAATVEPNGSVSATVSTHQLTVTAGSDQWIAVAGPNLDQVADSDISIFGPDISIDSGNVLSLASTCAGAPFPFLVFRATVPAHAVAGGRSLLFKVGAQVSALTGGVRIVTAAKPPCTGDCGGDNVVTVDELLTMVNIALGNADVSDCLPGDANGDGQITVDEILTAVNNALNGCP